MSDKSSYVVPSLPISQWVLRFWVMDMESFKSQMHTSYLVEQTTDCIYTHTHTVCNIFHWPQFKISPACRHEKIKKRKFWNRSFFPKFFEACLHGDGFKCQVPGPRLGLMNFGIQLFSLLFLTSPLAVFPCLGSYTRITWRFSKLVRPKPHPGRLYQNF